MSADQHNGNDRPIAHADQAPEPSAHGDARQIAGEMLAHGLLTYLNTDTKESQEHRVQRVMAALHSEADQSATAGAPSRTLRFPSHLLRRALAMAACLGLVAAAFMLAFPAAPSAQAMVQQSIQAMRTGGDRRYEVRVMEWGEDQIAPDPIAVVDTRAPDLLVLRSVTPNRELITVGRDAQGLWAIDRTGSVERENPRRLWPRWATVGEESLFADSIDRVLEELSKGFDIKRDQEGKGALAGTTKITATRKKDLRGPGPDRFELWLNSTTKVVEKIELSWDTQPMGGPGGPGMRRPGDGGPGERPMRDRPDRPEGRDGPDGTMPRGDGPPPPRDGRRPPMGPDGPGGPGGAGMGGPGPRGPRGPGGGPGGPGGPGMMGDPRMGGRPPMDPRMMDGFVPGGRPPRMDPLSRVGPPRTIIMQRVEVKQALGDEWFGAGRHAGGADGATGQP